MSAPTLKDIAAIVGISINSASRALKDKSDIGLDTRKRVKEVAALLGYRPNINARGLVLRKTLTIGLAVTEIDNPVRMEFCEHLRRLALAAGYRLIITGVGGGWREESVGDIRELLSRGVDGLILGFIYGIISELPVGQLVKECSERQFPLVMFGMPQTSLADCLEIDFHDSSYRLTKAIIEKYGKGQIVFFGDGSASPRAQGYAQAMRDNQLDKKILHWPVSPQRLPEGSQALEAYLQRYGKPPRAIIAANDLIAIGVMSALLQRGFAVPGDTGVAGFDNTEFGKFYNPPLTSIGFDSAIFAQKIWELLSSRLDAPSAAAPQRLPLAQEFYPRQSL